MKYRVLDILLCPECQGELDCEVYVKTHNNIRKKTNKIICNYYCTLNNFNLKGEILNKNINCEFCYEIEIMEGLLVCGCGSWYPIIKGVPRMLSFEFRNFLYKDNPEYFIKYKNRLLRFKRDNTEFKDKLGTGQYERQKAAEQFSRRSGEYKTLIDERFVSSEFLQNTASRFGYEWKRFSQYDADNFLEFIYPIDSTFFKDKVGLDAGCGAGRHMCQAVRFGAEMFGVDLSEAVEIAFIKTKDLLDAHIIQADISHLPLRKIFFDFVYSLGVLHHLSEPQKSFNILTEFLKPKAPIFIWLYSDSRKFSRYVIKFIRKITTKMPNGMLRFLSFCFAIVEYFLLVCPYKNLSDIYVLNKIMNFITSFRIKFYAKYNFQVSYGDWFDRLSAPVCFYYNGSEVKRWFEDAHLRDIEISASDLSGWRGIGRSSGEET